VWALRDINFDVHDGDVLGIIGKNGAGKSTLLKILSRVTSPTTGTIKTKGRIASLLEVGTGFHPELTGRENIYLNGAILGMTKAEIREKEEEIIEFSGCQLYVDTPVKRYSSGMRVRLAFAVAAHLEPDILVVDEVLAVGDAEFQKKAIGKMKDISGNDGRTVLFVSHNMAAVKSLCTRGIVLENGTSVFEGTAEESVDFYLSKNDDQLKYFFKNTNGGIIKTIELYNNKKTQNFSIGEDLNFLIQMRKTLGEFRLDIGIYDENEEKITNLSTDYAYNSLKEKKIIGCNIKNNSLAPGKYTLNLAILDKGNLVEFHEKLLVIEILSGDYYNIGKIIDKVPSKFFLKHTWE
jgi:lipopolysaccharide transport system ATP-binding protein